MYGSNSNLDVLTKKITQQISEFLNKKYILGIIWTRQIKYAAKKGVYASRHLRSQINADLSIYP